MVPGGGEGQRVPAVAGAGGIDDAGGRAAGGLGADHLRARIRLRGVRQHSADQAGARAGRLRLGRAGLRRGLRRLDDLVRLVSRRRRVQPVSRSQVRRPVAAARLARRRRLRRRLHRPHACCRLESAAPDPLRAPLTSTNSASTQWKATGIAPSLQKSAPFVVDVHRRAARPSPRSRSGEDAQRRATRGFARANRRCAHAGSRRPPP